jgi:uncharacterized protein YyaL (SSP411 family)
MRHLLRDLGDRLGATRHPPTDIATHLQAAARWLAQAQDAGNDDGVAHSYDLRRRAWLASYPETTGYIIPTLYDYANLYEAPEFRERAWRMTRWEVNELLDGCAVRAGTMAAEVVTPTIFNTGQVLFGLVRAASESGDAELLTAVQRVADWLVAAQDADGGWRRYPSPFTTTPTAAYNVRCAFALVRAHRVTGDATHVDAAVRNAQWVLDQVQPNGWIPGNCLSKNPDDSALTHTLAYSIRGLAEVGAATGDGRFMDQACDMSRALCGLQRTDGSLPGQVRPDWTSNSRWSCVTGNAQMALNWLRLSQLTGDRRFRQAGIQANRFNMSVQQGKGPPETAGALPGSFPLSGAYMTWRFPNWATKFFMDALMLEDHHDHVCEIG